MHEEEGGIVKKYENQDSDFGNLFAPYKSRDVEKSAINLTDNYKPSKIEGQYNFDKYYSESVDSLISKGHKIDKESTIQ